MDSFRHELINARQNAKAGRADAAVETLIHVIDGLSKDVDTLTQRLDRIDKENKSLRLKILGA